MTLVYLDTETTGLDYRRHAVWEIAYAVDDGPVRSSIVSHDLFDADPEALQLNGYYDRVGVLVAPSAGQARPGSSESSSPRSTVGT